MVSAMRERSARLNPVIHPPKFRGAANLALICAVLLHAGASLASADVEPPVESHVTVDASLWPDADANDFGELDIDQLMAIDLAVTSIAGVEQDWFTTPAAMTVLTNEDLRRSGHRSIAEALRMVPGVNVIQLNSHSWALSTRGFTTQFANKQLMLIDGRKVYDPLFAGVLWDTQDVLFEDVEHIEVIRGPGASLWGANAVNGVINVETKHARDTQGLYVTGGVGTRERGFGGMRYGTQLKDNMWGRVWGKYFNRDSLAVQGGGEGSDDWDMTRAGFRVDVEGDDGYHLTLQGDGYHTNRLGENASVPIPTAPFRLAKPGDGMAAGANLLGRLSHEGDDSGWTVQAYYDYIDRVGFDGFEYSHSIVNLDFRHHVWLGERHQLLWGAGYEFVTDQTDGNSFLSFDPAGRETHLFSGFVQDTITLVPDRLFAMIGTKLEHNGYSGFEYQPSGRLWWTPSDRWMFWGAISRPVRTPTRADEDISLILAYMPVGPGSVPVIGRGGDGLESEKLLAYEAGVRHRPIDELTLDATVFYNDYRQLITFNPSAPDRFRNIAGTESYGLEASADWRAAENVRVVANYSFIDFNVHPNQTDIKGRAFRNQFHVRTLWDITEDLELNAGLYYTDNRSDGGAPKHIRMDVGVTWRPTPNVELSVWGQNLFDPTHFEGEETQFNSEVYEVERAFYFQGTIRF